MTEDILTFFLAYLLGSIPFGLVLVYASGKGDLRKIGSGNIGATNVLRTGNKFLALLTLLLDGGKGALAVTLAGIALVIGEGEPGQEIVVIAALGVFLGHVFPVWLKFKGGKGVATALGIYLVLSLPVGTAVCVTWLITALVFRYSSLAALISMLAAPLLALLLASLSFFIPQTAIVVTILIGPLVWMRHAANIRRLVNGTEPKIGQKKQETDAPSA